MSSCPAAIVTGAVGGIGLAFTKRFLERGYKVILADINTEQGKKVQEELGPDTLFVHCDVADWSSQVSLFEAAHGWAGDISVFVANAGIEETEPFYASPIIDEEPVKPDLKVLDIDFHSVIFSLKLLRYWRKKSPNPPHIAKFIATNSMAGIYEFPAAPLYSAAKHGVVGLVRSASHKLRKDELLTLNVISPGPVDTNISDVMKKVVPAEHFTPLSCILDALDKVVDEDITGQVIECSSQRFLLEDMKRFLA